MPATATSNQSLRDRLKSIRASIDEQRTDRAEQVKTRDAAKEAFAGANLQDADVLNSNEFKQAEDAVRAVGETDDKIAELKASETGILKMLGENIPGPDASGNGPQSPNGQAAEEWNSGTLIEGVRDVLQQAAHSKQRQGGINLGHVASRDALVRMFAADVTGTPNMRRGEYAGVVPQLLRPLRVLDLIPVGTTDGNSVPYTQEGGTFLAAETAEGVAKPEDGITFTDATAAVQTIAAWQKIRKQALADFAALQSIIDGRLRYSVQRRLEGQILNGDGADPNLRGILNTAGIGTVPFVVGDLPADNILKGITQVYLSEAEASGVVVHPTDWQNILMAKATGGDEQYYSGGPFSVTPQVIWGVPLVPHAAIAAGQALVGDFSIGVSLLIREGVQVLLSDSDQDDFIKNRMTMLGELRAALPVWRPPAFSNVDLAA